ncbi:MAG: hypothetical protein GY749_44835 [Desulfobacteraceae bacterium]|nr:hypothetical protein [Desulfobacteraceae bacterium]
MRQNRFFIYIAVLIFINCISAAKITAQSQEPEPDQKLLAMAEKSFRLLKKAAVKDGFSSALAALNMWRSNAQDAGIFDQSVFDDFKRRIYQKSINDDLIWFEKYAKEGWTDESLYMSKLYYYKSNVINVFDQAQHDYMKAAIEEIKKQKQEREQEQNKNKNKNR